MLHLFPVCPAEGSRPHRIIKSHMSLVCVLLCVCIYREHMTVYSMCVCVCTQACRNAYMYALYACGHMCICMGVRGLSQVIAHMCSGNCCDVLSSSLQEVFLQLKTKRKMTPAYACASSTHCWALCSLHRVPRAQWDGSVKDVHIKEGAGQH